MLVPATEMLKKAKAVHYAVGQFNINNLEWTKAVLLTAQEMNSNLVSFQGINIKPHPRSTGHTCVPG